MKKTPTSLLTVMVGAWIGLLPGCEAEKKQLGSPCMANDECGSNLCAQVPDAEEDRASMLCTRTCSESDPCPPELACAQMPDSSRMCVPPCGYFYDYNEYNTPAYTCVGTIPTPCTAVASGDYCSDCGCPSGQYCLADVVIGGREECRDLKDQGEPCSDHYDCISDNCGDPNGSGTKVCLVAIGTACTADNCESCVDGGQFCTRRCSEGYSSCPRDQNFICVGFDDIYYCHVNCGVGNCDTWDDPWECSSNASACPTGQSCDALRTNGYACMW